MTHTNGIPSDGASTLNDAPPAQEDTQSKSELYPIKTLSERLVGTALASIKANNTVMNRYATSIETHSENVNKSSNILNSLEGNTELILDGNNADDFEKQKKILELVTKIADVTGVEPKKELLECIHNCLKIPINKETGKLEVTDLKKDLTLRMTKEQLNHLKSLCKSVSDRVGKLETQDQMRLNQAQQDHSNTVKWIINVLNSIQSMMDKIIDMGNRR